MVINLNSVWLIDTFPVFVLQGFLHGSHFSINWNKPSKLSYFAVFLVFNYLKAAAYKSDSLKLIIKSVIEESKQQVEITI